MYKLLLPILMLLFPFFVPKCGKQNYPLITSEVSTYPKPAQTERYIFSTSQPNTTTIHGILLVKQPELSLPSPDDGIFLIPFSKDSDISVIYSTSDLKNASQAEVNEQSGEFVFTDVLPGQYIIAIKTISEAVIPALYPNNTYAIIEITNEMLGQSVEIGSIILP